MEFFVIFIIFGVLVILIINNKNKTNIEKAARLANYNNAERWKSHPTKNTQLSARNSFGGSAYNLDNKEVWKVFDYPWGGHMRPNGEVSTNGMTDIRVVGFNIEGRGGIEFIGSSIPYETKIRLKREVGNPTDKYAIEVYGKAHDKSPWTKLGYIPKDLAKNIDENYTDDLPLAAEPRRAGIKALEGVGFMAINILLPPSVKRKKYKKIK
ncbi:MAG: HIRAN domain-containing protein [Gammaproteobacteria bacterium]|nr:HIRAN domain-containing protein [Gammaproteobacteria bacterium]